MSKGCIYYLVWVTIIILFKSFFIVNKFREVFHDGLPGVPPKRKIDFGIDFLPETQPTFTTPYRMAPSKHKELKDQLKYLLGKGFIRLSISTWSALVLFIWTKMIHLVYILTTDKCRRLQ